MSDRLFDTEMERTAEISSCGRYRHSLGRHWYRESGYVLFVGLNPSTADAESDDPTIRRCINFARGWGYGGIEMGNLFDFRATEPKNLRRAIGFAVSDKNDGYLRRAQDRAQLVIAAWGNVPWAETRIREVFRAVLCEERRWHCLGLTKGGFPRHPLYTSAASKIKVFW